VWVQDFPEQLPRKKQSNHRAIDFLNTFTAYLRAMAQETDYLADYDYSTVGVVLVMGVPGYVIVQIPSFIA